MKSAYVFGAALAMGSIGTLVNNADAAIVTAAAFTFETSSSAFSASVTSPVLGPLVAESGIGTASASHAATGTVYSSPAGSGSARSLSANNYVAGDYFQFSVPTTGLDTIKIAFDAVSSSTGPKVFSLQYSTGAGYAAFGSYTLNTGTTTAFATAATNSAINYVFDLSGVTALNNNPLASFRLVEADTTTATGGTSRIDKRHHLGQLGSGTDHDGRHPRRRRDGRLASPPRLIVDRTPFVVARFVA